MYYPNGRLPGVNLFWRSLTLVRASPPGSKQPVLAAAGVDSYNTTVDPQMPRQVCAGPDRVQTKEIQGSLSTAVLTENAVQEQDNQ